MTDTRSDAVATLAQALGIIGRGPGRSRPLTRSEARDAFAALLAGTALDVQAGAFLLLMRYRGETAEELAGLVDAATAKHDLILFFEDGGDRARFSAEYDTDLFDAATIEAWTGYLLRIATAVAASPDEI